MFQIFFANAQNIFFSIIQRTYIFIYSSLNYEVVAKLQFFIFMGCSVATLRGHQEHSCYGTVSRIRHVLSLGSCPGLVFLFSTRRGGGVLPIGSELR
jgi:hypothetical protein